MKDLRESMIESFMIAVENGIELIVAVSDSTSTSKIKAFAEKYPDRVINVGIAEQNLIGVSAGLALGGYVVATANAAPFLVNRSAEQVRNDVAYSETNVKMMGLNPGFAYGALGATHHSLEDISMMRGLGGVRIYTPIDPRGASETIAHVLETEGPVYIRVDSGAYPDLPVPSDGSYLEKPIPLSRGDDVTILGMGTCAHAVNAAAGCLAEQGISADSWGIPSIRPLESVPIIESMKRTGLVISVEAHSVHGGLGSMVSEWISDLGIPVRLKRLGVSEGIFAPASPREAIEEKLQLNPEGIIAVVKEAIQGLDR